MNMVFKTNKSTGTKTPMFLQTISRSKRWKPGQEDADFGKRLIIRFDRVKMFVTTPAGRTERIDAVGEFYIIVNPASDGDILDENGEIFESESLYISGLKHDDIHPLNNRGKLILYLKSHELYHDIHMLIMEFDATDRNLRQFVRGESQLAFFFTR